MRALKSSPARSIRIALAEVPGLVSDLVKHAVASEPDMQIVKEFRAGTQMNTARGGEEFDVVVIALGKRDVPETYQRLLFGHPPAMLVAISRDGRRVEIYDRKVVREFAPEQLVEAIREVGHRRARQLDS